MGSINVVLYTSKTLKSGEHPIMLRIIKDRKIKYISLGVSCAITMWDETKNLPKRKHRFYKEILILIDQKKSWATKTLLGLEADESGYSASELKTNLVQEKKAGKTLVLEYFDDLKKRMETSGRIGYSKVFVNTKNSLKKFMDERDFPFGDIDNTFLLKYEAWFLARGVLPNSVFVFMRTLKTTINYARKEGLVKKTYDPFREFSFSKYRRIKTKKRAISKEDMLKIAKVKLVPESSMFHSRNYFLFSYYCRGINFVDIAHLKWENLKKDRLEYVRKKTNERFSLGLLEPAKKILNYYKKTYYDNDESYVFPILNETHQTPKSKDYRLNKIITRVNKDLKEIATKLKIKEKLTTYVARHTYATVLKKSGVSTAIISEALGHESESTTQVYLDSFENKVLDDASRNIL